MAFVFSIGNRIPGQGGGLRKTLLQHFSANAEEIATAGRQFPITARIDVQSALEELLQKRPGAKLLGIVSQNGHEAPQLASLLAKGPFVMTEAGPVQHDEIDIGEPVPARCLKNGL